MAQKTDIQEAVILNSSARTHAKVMLQGDRPLAG